MLPIIIILLIIALFIILSHIPIRLTVYAKYENNKFTNDFKIKYGFITVAKRKQKSNKPKKKPDDTAEKKKKTSPKTTVKFIRENISDIKRLICDVLRYATKKALEIEKLSITAVSGTDDAMDTALIYGASSAFLYNTMGVLEKQIKTKNIAIDYQPDFTDEKIFIEFTCIIKTKIKHCVGLAFLALRRVMPIMRKRGEKHNGKPD